MVGFNEVYIIDAEAETVALFTEVGELIKQWNNIYEFREDFSADCFESDEDMLRAQYQLQIDRVANNFQMNTKYLTRDHCVNNEDKLKEWTNYMAIVAQHPVFRN